MAEQRPIKMCHVVTNLPVGGAPEYALLLVEGLMRDPRFDVELMLGTVDSEGELVERAKEKGVRLVYIPEMIRSIHPVKDALALARMTRIFREQKYDIVQTHMSKAGILGREAGHLAGTPLIVHTLHSLVFHEFQPWYVNRFYITLKKLMARYTDYFVSVSDIIARKAVAEGIMTADRVRTIYSGMELEWFLEAKFDRAAVRAKLGIPEDALVVGKVGRLFPLKGHEQLFPAIPLVAKAVPGVRFLLLGDGILQDPLKARAKELGVSDNVIFAGWIDRERMPEMLGIMDVLVHTSLREGLARVFPQALAMGVPCVAYNLDGTPEVVVHDQTGFLVEPYDTQGLADALIRLLTDPELRRQFGEEGRRQVDPRYRTETMVEQHVALYEALMAEKGRPLPPR
jgi:glycosyltransferase involved in cell wall biosynthesis